MGAHDDAHPPVTMRGAMGGRGRRGVSLDEGQSSELLATATGSELGLPVDSVTTATTGTSAAGGPTTSAPPTMELAVGGGTSSVATSVCSSSLSPVASETASPCAGSSKRILSRACSTRSLGCPSA